MEIRIYLIPVFILSSCLFYFGCTDEDNEKQALQLLSGSYKTSWIEIRHQSKFVQVQVSDSSKFMILPNYKYFLYIKATIPNSDSVLVIQQNGTFEILKSRYEEFVEETIPIEKLEGEIMFNPENKTAWGGNFVYKFEMLNFEDTITIEGIKISFILWFKDLG